MGQILGYDVAARFLNETKRLYDLEEGRSSLPSVQAMLIMYCCLVGRGKDRAGLQYRYGASEMMKHLRLGMMFTHGDISRYVKEAVSRALWGIYCFET